MPLEDDCTKHGLSLNSLLPKPEPLLLLENRLLLEYGTVFPSCLRVFNRENAAMITAIRKMKPKMQNAMAILFGDTQKALSPGNGYVPETEKKMIFFNSSV